GTLLEITNPSEPATVTYAASETDNWRTLITTLMSRSDVQKTALTDLLRTAKAASERGCVRFSAVSAPTATEIANYRAGTATWSSLAWPLDVRGMRNQTCYMELQLVPDGEPSSSSLVMPFFWSTALLKEVSR